MSPQIIESTDLTIPRLGAAARSLTRWHSLRQDVLRRERLAFAAELGKTYDPFLRQELVDALKQNEIDQRELDTGWQNSSLRKHLSPAAETTDVRGIEHRISATTGYSEPTVLRESRAMDTQRSLVGLAAVFDSLSEDLGGFREKIERGAFASAIKRDDVRCLWNHRWSDLLGRTKSGTLRLSENRAGLAFACDLLDRDALSWAVSQRVERGDVSGCSFAFAVSRDRWILAQQPGQLDTRVIVEIDELFDVSPVSRPAYRATSCTIIHPRRSAPARPNEDDDADVAYYARERLIEQQRHDALARRAGHVLFRVGK